MIAITALAAAAAADTVGVDNIAPKSVSVRQGRKIQVDGFLLEWSEAGARAWPGSAWRWDAVSTADGVAGYVSLPAENIKLADSGINIGINTGVDDSINGISKSINAVINAGADGGINNVVNNNIDNGTDATVNKTVFATVWTFTVRAANTGRAVEMRIPGRPSGEFFAFDKEAFDRGGALTAEWIIPWEFFDEDEDADAYELTLTASSAAGPLPPITISAPAPKTPAAPGLLTRIIMIALIAVLTIALIIVRRKQMRESKSISKN